jgi:multisubunit Na+/H+ antiporter MnhB subunit
MANTPSLANRITPDHQTWVHSRLLLEREYFDVVREAFTLIAAGFGSFALFEGLATVHTYAELPKVFALAVTAVGIILVLLAARHNQAMTAWINADEYGTGPAPELPNERRLDYLAAAVIIIGVVSFIALLRLP